MRKLYGILALFLGLMMMSPGANALETSAIGTGTTSSSTYPFNGGWGSTKTQIIYTAAELTAAGLVPGAQITGLYMKLSTRNATLLQNWTIKVANTALTNFANTTFVTDGFTTVAGPLSLNRSTLALDGDGFSLFPFTTNYIWNGSSNIIVETSWYNSNTGGNGSDPVFNTTTSPNYMTLARYQDNVTSYAGFNTTASSRYYPRPNARFSYLPAGPWVAMSPTPINLGFIYPTTPATPQATGTPVTLNAGSLTPNNGGNLTITSNNSTNFSLSTTANGTYGSSITVPYTDSTLSNDTIYVRFNGSSSEAAFTGVLQVTGGGTVDTISRYNIMCHTDLQYCVPSVTYTGYYSIGRFAIANLNNQSAASLTFLSNSENNTMPKYQNFRDSVNVPSISLERGVATQYQMNVIDAYSFTTGAYVKIWADYNRNSVIDANELLDSVNYTGAQIQALGGAIVGRSITIPETAPLNQPFLLRAMVSTVENQTACGTATYGESEDYWCSVIAPFNMAYDTTTTTNLAPAKSSKGTSNVTILKTQVKVNGSLNPKTLNTITFGVGNSTAGTGTNPIAAARVYSSGSKITLDTTATLIGTFTAPTGNMTCTPQTPITLVPGANNFWLVYDIAAGATCDGVADAALVGVYTSDAPATNKISASQNPDGLTQITAFKFDGGFNWGNVTIGSTPVNGWTSNGFDDGGAAASGSYSYWLTKASDNYPSVSPYEGTQFAEVYSWLLSSDYYDVLYSPAFAMNGNNEPTSFSFAFYRGGYNDDAPLSNLQVYMNTTPSLTGATLLGLASDATITTLPTSLTGAPAVNNAGWYVYTMNIPAAFNGATNYIMFKGTSDYNTNVYLDNVRLGNDAYMAYNGVTMLTTTTNPTPIGSTNQMIAAFNIKTLSSSHPFALQNVKITPEGVSDVNDIQNAKVWYLGNATTFDPTAATLYGTVSTITENQMTVTRTADADALTLAEGNNLFVITYDIKSTAIAGNLIDCKLDAVTLSRDGSSTVFTVTGGNVAGNRMIKAPLNGTYTIGGPVQATRYYATLAEAATEINTLGMSADVNFVLAGDQVVTTTAEPRFGAIDRIGGGNYKLYIYPSTNVTISGTASLGLITTAASKGIVIDGRINRTGARGLTMRNTDNVGTGLIAIYLRNGANGSLLKNDDITIQYVDFTGFSNTNSVNRGVTLAGSGNTNINVNNCTFSKLYYGFYQFSNTDSSINKHVSFKNNTIGGTDTNSVMFGYYAGYTDSSEVADNTFDGIGNTLQSGPTNCSAIILTGHDSHIAITNNVIKNVNCASTGGYGAFGINSDGGQNNILIANNRISKVRATGDGIASAYFSPAGIRVNSDTNVRIYNNTIVMSDSLYQLGRPAASAAVLFASASAAQIDMRNNILVNTMTKSDTVCAFYAVMAPNGHAFFSTCTNNNYYVTPNQPEVNPKDTLHFIGLDGTTKCLAMADWKASTGLDAASMSKAITLTGDLHLDGNSALDNDLLCTKVAEAANDMDGIARRSDPEKTQMGADETDPQIAYTTDLNTTTVTDLCIPEEYTLTVVNAVTGFGDGVARTIGNPTFVYQWYKDGAAVDNYILVDRQNPTTGEITHDSIVVLNSSNYIARINQATQPETYFARVMAAGKMVQSATATLQAEQVIAITSNPAANLQLCTENGFTDLTVAASGTVTGYQWQKKVNDVWTDLPGYTNTTLRVLLADETLGAGDYRCVVFAGVNHCGGISQLESTPTNLVVVDPVKYAAISSPIVEDGKIDVCEGTDFEIALDMNQIKGDILGYEWQELINDKWTAISGSIVNGNKLTFAKSYPSESGIYRLVVHGSDLCNTKIATSNTISVNIRPYLTIINQPETQIVCKGNKIRLSVKPEGENPTYQWYKNGIAITAEENVTFDKPVFTIEAADYPDAGSYSCNIAVNGCVTGGQEGLLVSEPALVYVMQETRIINQPQSAKVIPGGDAVFEVKAHATGAPENYMAEYQWYKNATPLVDGEKYSGSKSSLLTVKNCGTADFTGTFHVVVTGLCGNAAISNEVNIVEATAQFATNPQSANVCSGEKATFTAEAVTTISPATINYAWHFVDANNVDAVMPSTANTLTVEANAQTAGTYYCVATVEPAGVVITSSNATLQVSNAPVIATPVADVTVATGEAIKLAEAVTGTDPITYKWFLNNEELLDFTGKDTLTTTATAAGTYNYRFEASNACGTVTDEITVTVTAGGKSGVEDAIKGVSLSDVMPNPVNGLARFTVTSDASRNAEITLLDAAGRTVSTIFNGMIDGTRTLDLNADGLASGSYFLNLTINGKTISKHVVIAK